MAKIYSPKCTSQNDSARHSGKDAGWGCSTFGGGCNYIHQDAAKTNFTTIPQPCSIKVIYKRKTLYSGAHASFRLSAGHQSASPASGNNKTSSTCLLFGCAGAEIRQRASLKIVSSLLLSELRAKWAHAEISPCVFHV